jgi:DNA repair exonuclease SbcCD nuclease subunit
MDGRDIALPINELPDFDYALLGHIHAAQTFESYGRPGWICTGSLDLADFGEEGDKKYYTILDTEKGTVDWREMDVRQYKTFHMSMSSEGIAHDRSDFNSDKCKGAVVRFKVKRPETVTPDYDGLRTLVNQFEAFDFRGFEEEVERTTVARAKEIVEAKSSEEYLRIWHENSDCPVPIGELLKVDAEIGEEVGLI